MYRFFDVPLWAVFALFLPQFETQRTTFVPLYAKRGLHLFQAATLVFQTISEFLTYRSTAWAAPRRPCRGGLRRAPSRARCRGSRRGYVYMFSLRLPIYTDFLLPASRHNPRHNFNLPRSPSTKRHNRDIIAAWQWGGKSGQSTWKKYLSIKQWDVGISLLCSYQWKECL